MIIASYKCGCAVNHGDDGGCLACCSAAKGPPEDQTFSENCWRDKFPKQLQRIADQYNSAGGNGCCPEPPIYEDEEPTRRIESEIAQKGGPYKELEAIINENRVVLRMQTVPPPIIYDPPCDCMADEEDEAKKQERLAGGGADERGRRTVVVYPEAKGASDSDGRKHKHDRRDSGRSAPLVRHSFEENPNVFVLRIRKQGGNNDRKNNIDLEFRTPRPWSEKMKAEAEAEAKAIKARAKEVRGQLRAQKKAQKKKKKSK